MEEPDLAMILSQLPQTGAEDTVAQVMAIYRQTMEVYEPAERAYHAAVHAGPFANSSSTSLTEPSQ